jgi:ethylmalonyl-CoA mutase
VTLWDDLLRTRYGIADERLRRLRYGVQVNSLGLTEQQPENNVTRILIEMLAVTLSKNARARAVQLPAWNEALGLPSPFDQQWSLRMQQVLAYETDLLEYGDLFDGNPVVAAKVDDLIASARAEMAQIDGMGGAIAAIDYMKARLVESNAERLNRIESGETTVVGVNRWTEAVPSPLMAGGGGIVTVDPAAEAAQVASLSAWRADRDDRAAQAAIAALAQAARAGDNIMPASVAAAKAGVTTGEWAGTLRAVHGEYRAPTGVARAPSNRTEGLDDIREAVDAVSKTLGRRLKFLIGKPGLDGHSNGAEQIAFRARDCGMAITYEGLRLTPDQIVAAAARDEAHVIGLSILSGGHIEAVTQVLTGLKDAGLGRIPVIVGGIIPDDDAARLTAMGVAHVYTPKDFALNRIMLDIVALAEPAKAAAE